MKKFIFLLLFTGSLRSDLVRIQTDSPVYKLSKTLRDMMQGERVDSEIVQEIEGIQQETIANLNELLALGIDDYRARLSTLSINKLVSMANAYDFLNIEQSFDGLLLILNAIRRAQLSLPSEVREQSLADLTPELKETIDNLNKILSLGMDDYRARLSTLSIDVLVSMANTYDFLNIEQSFDGLLLILNAIRRAQLSLPSEVREQSLADLTPELQAILGDMLSLSWLSPVIKRLYDAFIDTLQISTGMAGLSEIDRRELLGFRKQLMFAMQYTAHADPYLKALSNALLALQNTVTDQDEPLNIKLRNVRAAYVAILGLMIADPLDALDIAKLLITANILEEGDIILIQQRLKENLVKYPQVAGAIPDRFVDYIRNLPAHEEEPIQLVEVVLPEGDRAHFRPAFWKGNND